MAYFYPTTRNPEHPQPEICELCGNLIPVHRLIDANVEGLRGVTVCDLHPFEAIARSLPSYQDHRRVNPGPLLSQGARRRDPLGASDLPYGDIDKAGDLEGHPWALQFDQASSQAVTVADDAALQLFSPCTVQFRCKLTAAGPVLTFGTADADDWLDIRLTASQAAGLVRANATATGHVGVEINDLDLLNQDRQFTFIFGPSLRFFLDGVEISDTLLGTSGRTFTSGDLRMARDSAGVYSSCVLDEVRLWNIALTDQQVADTWDQWVDANASGLVGLWRLNDGTGSSAADATDNGNDGTLVNTPTWIESDWEPWRGT